MTRLKHICSTGAAVFGIYASLLVLSLLFVFLAGCGNENPISSRGAMAPGDDVILSAANKEVPGGQVTGIVEEEEDGQTVYEVQKIVNGVEYEIEISADGQVLEVEKGGDGWWEFWD